MRWIYFKLRKRER